jgi:proline racemase
VRITNVPSYLALSEVRVECPELGELVVDVAYGGNSYAGLGHPRQFIRSGERGAVTRGTNEASGPEL